MKQRTFLSIGSWVAISLVLWVIAWIISEAIPVFNTLLSLIVSSRGLHVTPTDMDSFIRLPFLLAGLPVSDIRYTNC